MSPPRLMVTTPSEQTFMDVYERVHDQAMDVAESLLDYDSAQDAVQQVAVELFKHWEELQPEQRNAGYFLRAVQHRAFDERQRLKSKDFVELTEEVEEENDLGVLPDLAPFTGDVLAEDLLDVIVGSMPRMRRHVWILVREARRTYKEAGELLNLSPRTVGKHMQLARAYIIASLERAGIRLSEGTIYKLLSRSSEMKNEPAE